MLKHVVSLKFKGDAKEAQIQKVVEAFAGLKKKVPVVKGFEMGINNTTEGLNKDFTHCLAKAYSRRCFRYRLLESSVTT